MTNTITESPLPYIAAAGGSLGYLAADVTGAKAVGVLGKSNFGFKAQSVYVTIGVIGGLACYAVAAEVHREILRRRRLRAVHDSPRPVTTDPEHVGHDGDCPSARFGGETCICFPA
jgi:hypothetical protein